MTPIHEADLRREMTREARALLGPGFVPEYYEQAAEGFLSIAEQFIDEAEQRGYTAGHRRTATCYRFKGRAGRQLFWESVRSTTGTTRYELISVDARRFWGRDYPALTCADVA